MPGTSFLKHLAAQLTKSGTTVVNSPQTEEFVCSFIFKLQVDRS